ncbi:amidase [Pseudahrensia aquimaris]|uniref:Indoleacetamide hydrolase n=1 Tax=Pseudahrensia aquimaris TaxID=744461 RepID=A0ABW3FNR7_9HYPH
MTLKRPATTYTGPELCALSAYDTVQLLRKGEVSSAELQSASHARVEQTDGAVNAMVTRCYDRAAAFDVPAIDDHVGCLAGLPIGIKDLSAVSGVRHTMGTPAMANHIATTNDPIVDILEARGGVVVGKTNTPEMGAGGNTFNAVFGHTRNPWDVSKNAGGSSGGAAVSLATGQVWLSQGSDLAGSLRTPAAYCGVVGLRPSPGRAFGGPMTLGFSGEGISGPMARDVRDCALFLDAMSGFDERAPLSLPAPDAPFQEAVARAEGKVRIAYAPDLAGFAPVESEIRSVMAAALEQMEKSGSSIDEVCPDLPGLKDTYVTLRALTWASLPGRAPKAVQEGYKRTLVENIEVGRKLTVDQIIDANLTRTSLYHTMRTFLHDFDVLACAVVGLEPTLAEVEYPLSVDGVETHDYIDWLKFSFLATVTGLPAISVPCGFTESGMPVGIQLIGPPRGDAKVLAVARALEMVLDLGAAPLDPR